MRSNPVGAVRVGAAAVSVLVLAGVLVVDQIGQSEASDAAGHARPPSVAEDLPQPGERVAVAGPDGAPLVCPDGERLKVEVPGAPTEGPREPGEPPSAIISEDSPPPPDGGGAPTGSADAVVPQVPRCGPTGGGADGEPVWVPLAKGMGSAVAPRRFVRAQTR
jgi:hypothetical protein